MTVIKAGDFVSDFGKFCYVAMIDVSYNPYRVVLVDLQNRVSLQDINSLQLLEEDQLDKEDLETMKSWAERAKQSYLNMQNHNVKAKDEA